MKRLALGSRLTTTALAGVVAAAVAGCTSDPGSSGPSPTSSRPSAGGSGAGTATGPGVGATTSGPAAPSATGSGPPVLTPSSSPTTTAPSVNVPAALCAAASEPGDVADAYVGALGAGELQQALACVEPGTVPEATTQSLLVTTGTKGAAYLRNDAGSSGDMFAYTGARNVTVTVSSSNPPRVTAVTAS